MKLPARVTICEVGTRDGFQIEPDFIPTEQKIEVVNLLSAAGVPRIEVTSFVHPKVVPQLRDAEQVMAGITRRPGTRYAALVPNDKGAVRAVDAGVDAIHTVVSASESHNLANVNMTVAESMTKLRAVMQVAERAKVPVACGISTSFGCPFEGDVPLAQLERVVRRLAEVGMPRIEVTSFVSPKAIPQLRDAAEVMAAIARRPGTVYSALVPNDKGAVRAVDARVDEIHTVVSASESHNLANVNMTIADSLGKLAAVAEVARRASVPVVSGISCSFGCPFEGDVPVDRLESVVARLVDMGARGIGLADTTGMANPAQVGRVLERLVPRFPGVEWTLHTHDTRAMAIPNILAAMEYGVTHFDASIGGLGGCPFAPGASGNVCTEDLIHCLHAMGVETGVDLDALLGVSRRVQEIVGRVLPGQLVKAGKWDRRYPLPDGVRERIPARA